MKDLIKIQQTLKAPKGQYNSFGKFKYRSCEDIIEAVKPIAHPLGYALILTDGIIEVGGRIYVEAFVTLTNGEKTYSATGYAREEETKKGMDGSQITGAASSYARKYALNGLLAIDDSKDADTQKPTKSNLKELTPNIPEWIKAVQFIKDGGNIDSILAKYSLTEENENAIRKNAPKN